MSKSYNNTIEIFGEQKATRQAIMRIVTDSKTLAEPKDPDHCNVFALYRLFADAEQSAALAARYRAGGVGYGEVKKALFEMLWSYFEPFRRRRAELAADPERVEKILRDGAARARAAMAPVLRDARRAIGAA